MATLDAVVRKLDGAVSNPDSIVSESHSPELEGGAEYPHYTRPAEFRGWRVPEVLLSGHHAAIERWRAEQVGKREDTSSWPEAGERFCHARPALLE